MFALCLQRANEKPPIFAAVIVVRKVTHMWRLGGALARGRLLMPWTNQVLFVELAGNPRFTGAVH
jgi:hypothetical protein